MKKGILLSLLALILTGCSSGELELFVVNGSAMEPTFKNGDYVLVDKEDGNFALNEVVIYTNARGDIILGRITEIAGEIYEISPDNEELGVNTEAYLSTSEEKIIGPATLCSGGFFRCGLKAL
ncbi:S24/S26 family peptidase [Candidatus Peregrinibacteria bacterium]|nr:MAG: S24/S26 family peptidase [Candidatus Peregrinibacteria bacterium]